MSNGFTILEVLVTLSIITILLTLAIPAYEWFYINTQDHIMSSQLFRAIQLARNQAMIVGETISLCGSSNQASCNGNWQHGYIVHHNNHLLFAFTNHTNKGSLHWRAFPGNSKELHFLPNGVSKENGTFWYCQKAKAHWAIVLSQSGRARVVKADKKGKLDVSVSCEAQSIDLHAV